MPHRVGNPGSATDVSQMELIEESTGCNERSKVPGFLVTGVRQWTVICLLEPHLSSLPD